MASLSNINGLFDVHSTGAILFSTSHGTSGQILRSNGNAAPTWVAASTVIGGPYLPLTGGTLSGATATATGINFTVGGNLFGTSATFTGKVLLNANNINFESSHSGNGLVLSHHNIGASNAIVSGDASNPDNLYINNGGSANDWSNVIIEGNVGIGTGTTSPGSKLDVNGTGYFSDLLRVDEPVYSYTDSGTKHYTHLATGSLYGSGNSAMIVTTNIPGHNQIGNANMFSFNLVGYSYAGYGMIDMTIGVYAGESNYYSASWTGTCQTNWINDIYVYTDTNGKVAFQIGAVTDILLCEIAATNFVQGFANVNADYSKGWTITAVTTLPTQSNPTSVPYKTILPDVYEDVTFHNKVGIGTSGPASVLHIKDNSAGPTQLSIQSNDFTRAEEINFLNPSTLAISGQIKYYTNPTVEYMSFSTSNNTVMSERMRINSSGNMQMADGSIIFLGSLSNTGNNWNFNSYSNGQLYLQQSGSSNLGVFDGTSGTYTAMSDINKKKDFENSEIGLKEVMGLKPKLYRMKTHSEDSDKLLGFLAQEVKEFIPQAYVESGADDNKFIGLTEMPIIAALTKAIQELKADNDSLKARIETLENN